jgi:glycosyltransferase involved in cell wall biosynthesis
LSEEKGVRTLIKAAVKANVVLNIAGGGPLLDELKEKYRKNKNIHFLGHLSAEKTAELLMNSQASIMPSECYENNPLGVIESLCAGTPVIGANIGGIPELIDNESGVVYPSGDVEELADKLTSFDRSKYNNRDISERSLVRFSAETHYRQLLEAYEA